MLTAEEKRKEVIKNASEKCVSFSGIVELSARINCIWNVRLPIPDNADAGI